MDKLPKDLINIINEYQRTKFDDVICQMNEIFKMTVGEVISMPMLGQKTLIKIVNLDYHNLELFFSRIDIFKNW